MIYLFFHLILTELDSANGNYEIMLNVKGPIGNLTRDGYILIQDGILHTQLLNDPIKFINGEAQLINNKLRIKNLSADLNIENVENVGRGKS